MAAVQFHGSILDNAEFHIYHMNGGSFQQDTGVNTASGYGEPGGLIINMFAIPPGGGRAPL